MDNKQKWMTEFADYFNETQQHLQEQPHQQYQQQHQHITSNANYTIPIETTEWFNSVSTLILLTLYGIVVFAGIFGNASLVITLFSQPSGRLRNPLLVALCLADLLVSGVSAPITIVMIVLAHKTWTLSSIGCKAIHYMQTMPIAASTICMLMLSWDRYATVRHPRLTNLRHQRLLPIILSTIAWTSACVLCCPILLVYHTSNRAITSNPVSLMSAYEAYSSTQNNQFCHPDYGSIELHDLYMIGHSLIVFVVPAFGVLLNHLGVRKKLCALSLTARAAHGELPLPMPILRRPTHMIIVTGMGNAARATGADGHVSSDEENNPAELNCMMEKKIRPHVRTPRSIRRAQMQEKKLKLEREQKQQPAPELPLPQTSTLRARRRLANMLVGAALIFGFCWTPHLVCVLCIELGAYNVCSKPMTDFSLLLGYSHSAVSPILYWMLNVKSLRQSMCAPCSRFNSAQRFLRSHIRFHAPPPPPSSTNEAALGPFNPRYIRARHQENLYRPPASSHYLY